MENQTKPTVPVTVPMEATLEGELRMLAAKYRLSRAELIRQIVNKYWKTYEAILANEERA